MVIIARQYKPNGDSIGLQVDAIGLQVDVMGLQVDIIARKYKLNVFTLMIFV